ncbi:MAG: hypothetical protein HOV70_23560 [Streptomyces sp.]|nr:hypothetical protein [Streptomyces sp.]
MALWACTECTARYSVGAPCCPQCGSTDHVEEGSQDMTPKVTVHGGPSIADEEVVVEGENGRELVPVSEADPDKVVAEEPREGEGGEDVSAGTSSETSSGTPSTTPVTNVPQTPSPAPKTVSRSGKDRKATPGSSAPTAGGGPADGSSATGSGDGSSRA